MTDNTVFIRTEDGNYVPLPGQVLPESSEVGHEEAWIYNLKDMVDDWSSKRASNARAWDTNMKALVDAWQKEIIRGSRELDEFNQILKSQMVRQQEEGFDARQRRAEESFNARERFRAQLDNVFANTLQMSLERMGTKQDISAEHLHVDPSETASEAMAAGLANQVYTQSAVESAIASGLANNAQTQGNISSAIAADVAETLRESIVAMGTQLAAQVGAMGDAMAGKIVEAMLSTRE